MGKEFNYSLALKQLVKSVKKNNKHAKISLIKKAFNFSKKSHQKQKRASGEEYFVHPFNVALLVAEHGLDAESICAALLHDVLEDTDACESKLQKEFGSGICSMVKGLTKIRLIVHKPKHDAKSEYTQKILLSTTKDVRIIVIKLFDKLHNMRTIEFLPIKKQKRIAQEVLDIYAPLAHKLGIHTIRNELADLAFPIVKPNAYKEIEKKIIVQVHKDEKEFLNVAEQVKKAASKSKINAFVYLRHKSPFAIFRKMQTRTKSFEEIYDYILITVLVDSVPECYETLGIIHNIFAPIPLKLKDYIAIPEPNLYQAIHTSVLAKKGKKIKFYIMTRKMTDTNKIGIISLLKENISKKELNEKIGFLKNISKIDKQSMRDPKFLEVIKTDFLGTRMFVFTPTGEIVELPFHATPLDYAFKIGLSIAPKAKKALVNGKLVSLSYKLSPGDMVEIIPAQTFQINYGWLKIVKGNNAKTKIKELLKKKKN